jgi:Protein of unknown function (DUF2946)
MRFRWIAHILFALAVLVQVFSPATAALAMARASSTADLIITDASGAQISLIICTHDEGTPNDAGQNQAHPDHCPFCHGAVHTDALPAPNFQIFAPNLASIKVLRSVAQDAPPRSYGGLAFHSRGPPTLS